LLRISHYFLQNKNPCFSPKLLNLNKNNYHLIVKII